LQDARRMANMNASMQRQQIVQASRGTCMATCRSNCVY
jgi:hypothetical protein